MPKIEKVDPTTRKTYQAKTKEKPSERAQSYQWWNAGSQKDLVDQLIATASFLKLNQHYRQNQASLFSRLYGNQPIVGSMGQGNKIASAKTSQLPIDRPTMNVVQSCTDTLVSRITQSRPRPQFLTDNGDYKQRNLGKQLNHFIDGEFYRLKAHALGEFVLRDACVIGDGYVKFFERDKKVACERVLATEIFEDPNDALYGDPRSRIQIKLVDRSVLAEMFPEYKNTIQKAENAYPDNSSESTQTVADQVMVVEGWHLPSGEDAEDGRHVIACTAGLIDDDQEWDKQSFPFSKLPYSPRLLGTQSQGLAEQLMGTQVEINRLLITITRSINLVGVPRIFVEDGSKVVGAHFNNEVGSIIKYRGTAPSYQVAPCMPAEVYAQLQRLVDYAYQQSGISALSAASQKPAGLDSGKALREFDDIQSDRFAALDRRYHNFFIDMAYQIVDLAKDIADRDGKYSTVYPNKDGTREIDLPAADIVDNPFVIQCFDSSSLPRDPAGRKQAIVEDMQAGILSQTEGRRLLDYPDLEQDEKLANAAEERILQILDKIVHEGKFTPPDPFMPLDLAITKVTQYYNLYAAAKLEEKRQQMLRDFFVQVQALKQAAQPPTPAGPVPGGPPAPAGPGQSPQAVPAAPPVSDLLPNSPGAA